MYKNRTIAALSLLLCLLLIGCQQKASPSSPSPAPSPTSSPAPWQVLIPEGLPEAIINPAQLNSSLPPISLLGHLEEADIYLYGLNKEYGGGILLRRGEDFTHFDQPFFPNDLSLAQLPTLWWQDLDGDGQSELAVKYHTGQDETGGCTYDLIFYSHDGSDWASLSAGRDFCAEAILKEVDTNWDERTHVCTLTHGGQKIAVSFPADTAPGRLVIGHLCLFLEENGQFSVIVDAWFPTISSSAATFRAQILYDGESVTLQNIRMDSFAGV